MNISIPDTVAQFFSGRINLLIVEDNENLLFTLAEIFSTPCISVTKASDITEARTAITRHEGIWHGWIIDLCLEGKENAGMELIEEHGNFPFAIVYSGMGSMESASYAIRLGAEAVIDKGSGSIAKLIKEVGELAPLAALCKGTISKSKEILFLLKSNNIREPKDWAEKAGMSLRQLQNISTMHTGLPPSLVIPFYYGLRHMLISSLSGKRQSIDNKDDTFYQDCINLLQKNLPSYQNIL